MKQRYGGNGSGHGEAHSLGIYASWISNDGWFFDATLRHFWASLDLTSREFYGEKINYKPETEATAFSFEVGRRITFGNKDQWMIEPRLEMVTAWIRSDSMQTSTSKQSSMNINREHDIHFSPSTSVQGTVGLSAGYRGENWGAFVKGALVHEFDGKTDVTYDGYRQISDPSGTRVMFDGGMDYRLNERTSIYCDAEWEHGARLRSIGGNVGIRYSW